MQATLQPTTSVQLSGTIESLAAGETDPFGLQILQSFRENRDRTTRLEFETRQGAQNDLNQLIAEQISLENYIHTEEKAGTAQQELADPKYFAKFNAKLITSFRQQRHAARQQEAVNKALFFKKLLVS